MDLDALTRSYRIFLQASIQIQEVGSFGGGLVEIFQKEIDQHRTAEQAYIKDELAKRSAHLAELKSISGV